MIRIRLKQLIDDKSFQERSRITIGDVVENTGLSRATLTRILNLPGYNVRLDAVDALCRYLQCQPGDLLEYVEEGSEPSAGQ